MIVFVVVPHSLVTNVIPSSSGTITEEHANDAVLGYKTAKGRFLCGTATRACVGDASVFVDEKDDNWLVKGLVLACHLVRGGSPHQKEMQLVERV